MKMPECPFCYRDLHKERTALPEYMLDDYFYSLSVEEQDEFIIDNTKEVWACPCCGQLEE